MDDVKPDGAAIAEQAVNPLAAFAAQPGTLTAQIQITRAGTGKVEDYPLVFTPIDTPKEN